MSEIQNTDKHIPDKSEKQDAISCDTMPIATSPKQTSRHRPVAPDMDDYAEKIRLLREGVGLNKKELAEVLNITGNAVSNWEAGRSRPDLSMIKKLCAFFGISADDFFGITTARPVKPLIKLQFRSKYTAKQELLFDAILALPEKEQRILTDLIIRLKAEYAPLQPIIRTYTQEEFDAEWTEGFFYYSSACAGEGNEIPGDDEGESVYVRRSAIPADFDCIIPIDGDSMEPDYHSGDRVLVKRTESFNYGDIVVVFVNDVCMIKEYTKEGLRPLNDGKYRIIRITDSSSVRPFGKVVGVLEDGMLPDQDEQRSIDLYLEEHQER